MSTQNRFDWLKAIQLGAVAGTTGILISLVGMLEEFDSRDIIAGSLSMGWTMLFLTVIVASYFSAATGLVELVVTVTIAGLVGGVI